MNRNSTIVSNNSFNENENENENESDEYISDEEPYTNLTSQILNNRYICLCFISNGSFSSVWVIYDILDFNLKSAKIFHDSPEEFKNETQIFNKLNSTTTNPNIVKCFDIFEEEDVSVIVTELLGISLLDIINDLNSNTYTLFSHNIKRIFYQILNGINGLQSLGIIHADIKPDNILLDLLPTKMLSISTRIEDLNLFDAYNQIQTQLTPPEYEQYNKNKKKMIKRKIKIKSLKLIRDYIFKKIDFNSIQSSPDGSGSYNIEKLIENKFTIKIIDFSNSEFDTSISQNELYIRSYRPLENIINIDYNKKSEIWAVGCLFYELLTGLSLFQLKKFNTETETNIDHIYNILETFKTQNYIEIVETSDFYDMFFRNQKLKVKTKYEILEFREKIKHNSILEFDVHQLDEMYNFLSCLFIFNVNLRPDCNILLNHTFFNR